MSTLPAELFLQIFQHLQAVGSSQDLATIAGVSSLCHDLVIPLLYRLVTAENERYVDALHTSLQRHPAKGAFIWHLVLPRHVPVIVQDEDSEEGLWWTDMLIEILSTCTCLRSLEIHPTSEAVVKAIPWATLERISVATRRPVILRTTLLNCSQIKHLNLVDFNNIAEHCARVLEENDLWTKTQLPLLELASAEWVDLEPFDRVYLPTRLVDFVSRLLDLPQLQRIVLGVYVPPFILHNRDFVGPMNPPPAFDLLRPLNSRRIFIAAGQSAPALWRTQLDGDISYGEIGDAVCERDAET